MSLQRALPADWQMVLARVEAAVEQALQAVPDLEPGSEPQAPAWSLGCVDDASASIAATASRATALVDNIDAELLVAEEALRQWLLRAGARRR